MAGGILRSRRPRRAVETPADPSCPSEAPRPSRLRGPPASVAGCPHRMKPSWRPPGVNSSGPRRGAVGLVRRPAVLGLPCRNRAIRRPPAAVSPPPGEVELRPPADAMGVGQGVLPQRHRPPRLAVRPPRLPEPPTGPACTPARGRTTRCEEGGHSGRGGRPGVSRPHRIGPSSGPGIVPAGIIDHEWPASTPESFGISHLVPIPGAWRDLGPILRAVRGGASLRGGRS